MKQESCFRALAMLLATGSLSLAAPVLNGEITSEGWIHLTESSYARPILGGSSGDSDSASLETSGYHRWDGINGVDVDLGSERGNVQNLFIQWDNTYLYIAVEGPTAPFVNWSGPNGGSGDDDGDQGDLYIALDTHGGTPSGYLVANDAHRSLHDVNNPQAVDFEGWQPNYFVGVDWVDNVGNGSTPGQGYANLEAAGSHSVIAGEAHGAGNGGFEWAAGYHNNRGVYEFAILWSDLGFVSVPEQVLRFAMYTTYNADYHDTYDSGPGIGQVSNYEEIGDFPGDYDDGSGDDGLYAGTAGAHGVPSGSYPGSNYVDPGEGYGNAPKRSDQIDTISEYLAVAIPEPGTVALMILGLAGLLVTRPPAKR